MRLPHETDPAPIYGLDLVAGPNKVTGAFHDFSPVAGNTPLDAWFAERAATFTPAKTRVLPDWARAIFSPSMIAANNITDPGELDAFLDLTLGNLDHYLTQIGQRGDMDHTPQHNAYCRNQKQNPHTPRVMASLGFDAPVIHAFIENCLFPELEPSTPSFRV